VRKPAVIRRAFAVAVPAARCHSERGAAPIAAGTHRTQSRRPKNLYACGSHVRLRHTRPLRIGARHSIAVLPAPGLGDPTGSLCILGWWHLASPSDGATSRACRASFIALRTEILRSAHGLRKHIRRFRGRRLSQDDTCGNSVLPFPRLGVILREAPPRSRRERAGLSHADRRISLRAAVTYGYDILARGESVRDIPSRFFRVCGPCDENRVRA
jgi:hypothetical protein